MNEAQELLNKMLATAIAEQQTKILADNARMVTFYRLVETNPEATPADMDTERKRLMDGMLDRLEAIPWDKVTARSALKESLLYFAEQL